MTGKYDIVIENRRLRYEFTIDRSVTVIKGFSGTGKSTLFGFIESFYQRGTDSGVTCNYSDLLIPLYPNSDWKQDIKSSSGKIFILDEDCAYVRTRAFAGVASKCDNYFIIISRNPLGCLSFSIDSVFRIKSEFNSKLGKTVNTFERVLFQR